MQPCTCNDNAAVQLQVTLNNKGVKAHTGGLQVDAGIVDQTVRKIRLPRNTDRTVSSGSYWAYGSWGRVFRTDWAYPAHDAYAIECYQRLVSRRKELYFDVDQLAELMPKEAVILSHSPAAAAGQVEIDVRTENKKHSRDKHAPGNTSLTRLSTVYQRYRVPSSSCIVGSGTFNFTCIIRINVRYETITPGQPAPEVCFITIGDWGDARKSQKQVAAMVGNLAEYRMVKFMMSTGDNFYPAGVLSTADPQWISTFEVPFSAQSLTNIRWFISLGNHDQWGYMPQKQYAEDHPRWYLPDYSYSESIPLYQDAKKESNETLELAVLNSAGRELPSQVVSADQFFLTQDARHGAEKDTSRHWRLVLNHEPIYSGGLHGLIPERNELVKSNIQPSLRQHMVHAYFNGDDHFLEIHRNFGTDFFTSGGGCGSDSYSTTLRPTTKWNMFTDFISKDGPGAIEGVVDGASKRASSKGAMLHCVKGGEMKTYVVDEEGTVMHTYVTLYDVEPTEFDMEIIEANS
ncbi:acid phosphatase, putative [Bodo saltans]|uniref:Acid phosphatase, putative n=1 Tax=Bodo saltans TaxID=75058 RepID=A0A0S4JGS0_BODSA|nr:acid phosphatase, putative [Bodo saltans]|eukprot:CUG90757.1 acid phosphatase, putative [Bodo saltans]